MHRHTLALSVKRSPWFTTAVAGPNKKLCRREYGSSQMEDEDIGTFQQRLSLRPHEGRSFEPVPVHFFQKYIAYARAHVFPQ